MGSSAADSQLATARSQLRFQSAAFSSSLQTAAQTFSDQNNITGEQNHIYMKKIYTIEENFETFDGIGGRKLSLEKPNHFPRWCD